jgi:DNA-binding NtrC family response regulator
MAAATTSLKTFILEDDPDAREAMTLALEREGFEVETATTVGGALMKIEMGLTPGAAILDMKLPDATAGIVLWRLRRRNHSMPIAVVTGMPDALTHPELVKEPPDKLFIKPVDLAALVEWLKSAT